MYRCEGVRCEYSGSAKNPKQSQPHFGTLLVVGASLSEGTLSGDCHGATKMVASHNDTIGQRTFTMALPRDTLRAPLKTNGLVGMT